ncbi:MAG: CRISPR-associated helicase Cas3' [Bacteroidales bacterium]|nr:CRISPR-associated helicase Cas3' [Candidatus Scybalocola fimicaballi]
MSKHYKYPLLAKPSGITLEQHSLDVMSEGSIILSIFNATCKKYRESTGKDLNNRVDFVARYHDLGKSDDAWQNACQEDYIEFCKWQKQNEQQGYNEYVSHVGYNNTGKNIRKCGVRHELKSLSMIDGNGYAVLSAIAAHHGKLCFQHEDVWSKNGDIAKQRLSSLIRHANDISDKGNLNHVASIQYEYSAVRALLQMADHRASAREDGDVPPPLTPFKYTFPHKDKRIVQQLVADHWQDDLLLLRAPTGAGKTDASLLWASLQIENKRAERMVIAMPTRFTSNALAINVAESLSDTGLYHSSAWYSKFENDVKNNSTERRKAEKLHEMARLLETPVTVCTIDHLLMALTLSREDHHIITFNLANSCLVIDEADFYDQFTQANINVLLKVLRQWKVPVLLMSASLPQSVLPEYQALGYNVKEIVEDTSDKDRIRFEIKSIIDEQDPDDVQDLLEKMVETGKGIIYVNTVEKAFVFAKWFEEKCFNDVIIYHSRFTEEDKKEKEKTLIDALGKNAWKSGTAHGIAVMTQIGEMSINISADMMISEMCPIDRLAQRAGRLCRFDKTNVGELFVLNPKKENKVYPAPYGSFDRKTKTWIACEAYDKTVERIRCSQYSAQRLVDILNEVYAEKQQYSVKAQENAKRLEESFIYNWLVAPMSVAQQDDTDTDFWKSRDIIPQDSVFVSKPENLHFAHWREFQEWKISNSIELPLYMIKQGIEKYHTIDSIEITIGYNDRQTIYVIREGFYDSNKGVNFRINEDVFL